MAIATVTSKGQITLPLEVRRRLGLKRGDKVDFVLERGSTVVRPAGKSYNPFLEDVGLVPALGTLEDVHAWIHEMRDEDDGA